MVELGPLKGSSISSFLSHHCYLKERREGPKALGETDCQGLVWPGGFQTVAGLSSRISLKVKGHSGWDKAIVRVQACPYRGPSVPGPLLLFRAEAAIRAGFGPGTGLLLSRGSA